MTENDQAEMRAQVAIARQQLRSLEHQLAALVGCIRQMSDASPIGDVLTAVMLGGFTLELGLKIFHMTYGPSRPHGHDLTRLFDELPEQIRGDISATFAGISSKALIKVYGFTISPNDPDTTPDHEGAKYDTAANVLVSSRRAFVRARYFFEEPTRTEWTTIDDSSLYMLELSRAIVTVYDEYVSHGGWGESQISSV